MCAETQSCATLVLGYYLPRLRGDDYVTTPDNQIVGRQWFQLLIFTDYLP